MKTRWNFIYFSSSKKTMIVTYLWFVNHPDDYLVRDICTLLPQSQTFIASS